MQYSTHGLPRAASTFSFDSKMGPFNCDPERLAAQTVWIALAHSDGPQFGNSVYSQIAMHQLVVT